MNPEMDRQKIRSFRDLDVYQNAYRAMLMVFKHILPKLPMTEKNDLYDQLKRASKAVPRLIAEGHSKRHQKRGFQKYLDDAMAESNENIVSVSQARDLYGKYCDAGICEEIIDLYDKISRQLYKLSVSWSEFADRKPCAPSPVYESHQE